MYLGSQKGYEIPFCGRECSFRQTIKLEMAMVDAKSSVLGFFNTRMPAWMYKNQTTIYIQTWHGTPLKKLGLDIETVKNARA